MSLQTVLSQTAYMLFYAQEKKGSKMANGVKGEGTKSAPVQMKRSRPDADDMEDNNTKARSTEELSKDKRVKVDEGLGFGMSSELTKAERKKLKQEKKRAQMEQEKEKSQKSLNDYDLATSAKASLSSSTSFTSTMSFASSASAVKSIFGVPLASGASFTLPKNLSPLADLDFKPLKVPVPKATATPAKKTEMVVEGWKVTEGVPKSRIAVDSRSLQTGKSGKEEYVQDGWTVRVAPKVN